MRTIVFRNITSLEKRRRIISSSESVVRQGVHSVISRRFICMIRPTDSVEVLPQQSPRLSIVKERNAARQCEKFFCKIKGRAKIEVDGICFDVFYLHSLHILISAQQLDYAH